MTDDDYRGIAAPPTRSYAELGPREQAYIREVVKFDPLTLDAVANGGLGYEEAITAAITLLDQGLLKIGEATDPYTGETVRMLIKPVEKVNTIIVEGKSDG